MSEKEAAAARVAEIRCDLKAVWDSRSFPPGSGGTLGRLLEGVAWLLEGRERQAAELERLRAQITAVLYQIEVARSENRLAHWQAWELAQTVERLLAGNAAAETGEPE
jgi:hypothetical protein